MIKKSKNKKHKQIKVKKDFTKIKIAEKLADKKRIKIARDFVCLFVYLFWIFVM